MPPNLGGFFMVRSYYPSECHADYFDFERIEALKPAIEACGISTLSQSPMLGFHKQMDNRIKLLEEILRSEERFSRNAETDVVCRLLLAKTEAIPQTPYDLGNDYTDDRPYHPSRSGGTTTSDTRATQRQLPRHLI